MKQSDYRAKFVRKYPGVRRFGMGGYWYRCANCGGWCGRPGAERANIPDNLKMEVDHIRPWSQGGSDEIWNLQPMCKPCNRSKSNSMTMQDSMKTGINSILHPIDALQSGLRKSVRNNKILKGLGLTKRK